MQPLNTHIFAFFFRELSFELTKQPEKREVHIHDEVLLHRIMHVLKMKQDKLCIFFDKKVHISGMIQSISKREIIVLIEKSTDNTPLSPHITLYLPLLKRTNLEEAVYLATECGISEIQLIITKKSQQKISERERARLEKMSISACEQAKYFTIPNIHAPQPLQALLSGQKKDKITKIYFDPSGMNFLQTVASIPEPRKTQFAIFIGPEGGFTQEETTILSNHQYISCSLTPTILRSKTAVGISIALLRLMK